MRPFGIGVEGKYFTPWRITGIVRRYRHHFCRVATVALNLVYPARYHSRTAGLLAGWQPGECEVAEATETMLRCPLQRNASSSAFCVTGTALAIRITRRPCHHPVTPLHGGYLGGPLGLLHRGLMAILVKSLGLLMLGVASATEPTGTAQC